jgi:hypothetical protein
MELFPLEVMNEAFVSWTEMDLITDPLFINDVTFLKLLANCAVLFLKCE